MVEYSVLDGMIYLPHVVWTNSRFMCGPVMLVLSLPSVLLPFLPLLGTCCKKGIVLMNCGVKRLH